MMNELLFALEEKVWMPLDVDAWDSFISHLKSNDDAIQPTFVHEHTRYCAIPFYPDCQLVRIKTLDSTAYFVKTKTGEIHYLDGKSSVIHKLNKSGYLTLTQENIAQYLFFFCFFVQTDKGPFLVLDSMHNPILELLKNDDGGSVEEYVEAIKTYPLGKNGWVTYANVYFDKFVFSCEFKIEPDGDVKMISDQPLQSVDLKSEDDFSTFKLLDFSCWIAKHQHLDLVQESYKKHLLQWTSNTLQ